MNLNTYSNFKDDLEFSKLPDDNGAWVEFFHEAFRSVTNVVNVGNNRQLERQGIDYLVILESGKQISIDIKKRRNDYGDIYIEEWSVADFDWSQYEVIHGRKVGWSLDINKTVDYIAYWTPLRAWLIPFRELRQCSIENIAIWKKHVDCKYPIPTKNKTYTTVGCGVDLELFKGDLRRYFVNEYAPPLLTVEQLTLF
jgi:hypothetical protein